MAAADDSPPEMYLNFYNAGQPKIVYVSNSISPSPSAQSENSIECTKEQQHDIEDSSDCGDEDSAQELTNLTWLTQLKNLVEWPNSINPILDDDTDNRVGLNGSTTPSLTKKDTLNDRFQRFVGQARQNRETYNKSAALYQMDTTDKPPFNYAQMIAMAMLENGRMTLQHIYSWIQNKFGYYRVRNNWNNSIRHNLSLQFCFRKIDRNVYNKGDGKGGYWELGIDANKSERKRIRNRSGIRSQKRSDEEIEQKRLKSSGERINLKSPEKISTENVTNNFTINRNDSYPVMCTLNSINAPINIDQSLIADEIGIGSIVEVDHQITLVGQDGEHQLNTMDLSQISNEYHVLGEMTNGDYLNINTLDLMSSGEDIFDSNTFTATVSTTQELSTVPSNDPSTSALITTMVDTLEVETQNGNEIFLASEVPQPSENVVISALNSYDDETTLCIQSANVIIQDTGDNFTSPESISENEGNNLIKSFNFEGIDQDFQLLSSCTQSSRDDLIKVFFDISSHQDF